jgi:hypothetical protein
MGSSAGVVRSVGFSIKSALISALLMLVGIYTSGYAQSGHPSPHEVVVSQIKALADSQAEKEIPLETPVVLTTFGASASSAGITSAEIVQIYEGEYAKAKELHDRWSWWMSRENAGWAFSALLSLGLIFRDALQKRLSQLVDRIGGLLYGKLAGTRLFQGRALSHYRRALVEKNKLVHIPFRPDRPLDMHELYVPLKAAGSTKDDPVDAAQLIREHHRSVIIGSPGAGKSTFLRHLVLTWGERGFSPALGSSIPVLLELKRINDEPEKSLEQHLIDEFGRCGFPRAERFIRHSLEQNLLVLLFDALDEVKAGERTRTAQRIKDFARRTSRNSSGDYLSHSSL